MGTNCPSVANFGSTCFSEGETESIDYTSDEPNAVRDASEDLVTLQRQVLRTKVEIITISDTSDEDEVQAPVNVNDPNVYPFMCCACNKPIRSDGAYFLTPILYTSYSTEVIR